jgi:cytochrome oxidase Cu insertion factor (SCO1/SenC/PrrC family)
MHRVFVRLVVPLMLAAVLVVAPASAGAAPGPAPAFTLDLFSGKSLSLADLKGKAVIMLFWTQW